MRLEDFARNIDLVRETELEKVRLLAFYYHKTTNKREFDRNDILEWFDALHYPKPNISRLVWRIKESRLFVKAGSKVEKFKLHAVELDKLQAEHPGLRSNSEEVLSEDTILPNSLYESTRGFIESLSKQINASYEYNIFDGCAVLMRRLLEILLILAYENLGVETEIQDAQGNYQALEKIISNAKTNKTLKLSRDAKLLIDEFRLIGNFSAHKIYYNCRRSELTKLSRIYRATIEELLYKSGIRS